MYLLQPIVYLPEWELVPEDLDDAVAYMRGWDCGEYTDEPERVDTIYPRYGNAQRRGDYVLHRYYDGAHALYRVLSEN